MKGKNKVLISYYISGLVLLLVWYFSHRYNRSYPLDFNKIDSLGQQIETQLKQVIHIDLSQVQSQYHQNYQQTLLKVFKKDKDIIDFTPLQSKPNLNELHVVVQCSEQKAIEFDSNVPFNKFNYKMVCQSEVEQKDFFDLRRIVLETHKNINANGITYIDNMLILDVYTYNQSSQQHQQTKEIAKNHLLKLLKLLNFDHQNIRINFKRIREQEFDSLDKTLNQTSIDIEEMKTNIIQENVLFQSQQNRINYKQYKEIEILIIQNSQNSSFQISSDQYDQLNIDNNSFMLVKEQKQIQNMLTNIIFEQIELKEISQIKQFLKNVDFKLTPKLISQYLLKREQIIKLDNFLSQIKTLKFYSEQPENFYFTQNNQKQVEQWILQTEKILASISQTQSYIKFIQNQENLNELDNIGLIESFIMQYTMGVYMPLTIPILYPYLLSIFTPISKKYIQPRVAKYKQKMAEKRKNSFIYKLIQKCKRKEVESKEKKE